MAEFSVNLGGGLYMDSNGVLSHGPVSGKPVYGTPGGGLPVSLDTLEKTFTGLAKALPDKDDPKSREKFDAILKAIGMATADKENLINALQAVGAVASVIGSVIPILGAAIAVLTLLLGLFKEGPSPLEILITRRFDDLARQISSLETQIRLRDLRGQRSEMAAALAALANYLIELKNTPPDAATLLLRQQDMRNAVHAVGIAVRNMLDTSTWLSTFNPNEFRAVWPFLQNRLHTFPRSGPPARALMPASAANRFDHALMVPLCLFAITAYLTVLRGLAPEYRSTREHREDLWDFARDLETLAENMRNEGLARTVYTTADFEGGPGGGIPWGLSAEEVTDFSVLGFAPFLMPGLTRFTVGAMDLCVYSDTYFTPGFGAGSIQFPGDQYAKQGLLNVRWMPPAILERYEEPIPHLGPEAPHASHPTRTLYRITNAADCAKAANAQSERDYADLLYSSGYLNLVHLIAVVRNEAVDPDISQTVRIDSVLQRKPGVDIAVTVESEQILLTGVITAPAQQQPQQFKATAYLTTQPLGRERKLSYKVWLRTLAVSFSNGVPRWNEQAYGDFYQLDYVDDAAHKGCKTLVTSKGSPLGQVKLAEGTSVAEARHVSGTAVMQAVTHEWWIPVKPLKATVAGMAKEKNLAALRATGWEADAGVHSKPAVSATAGRDGPSASLFDTATAALLRDRIPLHNSIPFSDLLGWIEADEPAHGQHRHASQNEIRLEYDLHWQADQMTVTLTNHPENRNYVVYLVVEETLGSGKVLHTTRRIPVIGQLTFVPQTFFDEEKAAIDRLTKTMSDFARHYAISASPVPGHPGSPGDPGNLASELADPTHTQIGADPVLRDYQSNSFATVQSLERLAARAAHHPPAAAVLRQVFERAGIPMAALPALVGSKDVNA